MFGKDVRDSGKIGNGAGNFDDAGVGPGAQAKAVYQLLQQLFTGIGLSLI